MEKWRGVQNPEIEIVDYYSEGFGQEGKWVMENNRWNIGSREECLLIFLVIISISIQNLSHICICNTYMSCTRKRLLDRLKTEIGYNIGENE